jgi:hypothetical protein
VFQVDLFGQTDIANLALVGVVLFAIGAIAIYLMAERK